MLEEITSKNINEYIKSIFTLDDTIICDTRIMVSAIVNEMHDKNYLNMMYSQLLKELNDSIQKYISQKMEMTEYTKVFNSDKDLERASFDLIRMNSELFDKKVILGSLIATSMQDMEEYVSLPFNSDTYTHKTTYPIGKFNGNEVFVDAYKRFNDNTFSLYDNIRYNVELLEVRNFMNPMTPSNNISIEVRIGYEFDNVERYAIICSDGYINRDVILDRMKKEEL